MCGIFGTSDYNENTEVIIDYLAYEMEDRGKDSWGITDGHHVYKRMGYVTSSFDVPEDWTQMIGHCRASSVGKVTIANQHPFEFKSNKGSLIVGIHNGTLSNHHELNRAHNRDFDVDTQHIYAHLAEGKSFKDIRGSAVLAYYEDGVLHLGRFNSTALHVVRLETGEVIFASTKPAVLKAVRAGGGEIATEVTINENHLYSYDPVKRIFYMQEVDGFASYTYYSGADYLNNKWATKVTSKKKLEGNSAPTTAIARVPSGYSTGSCHYCKTAVVDFSDEVLCADCLEMFEVRLAWDEEDPTARDANDVNYPNMKYDYEGLEELLQDRKARDISQLCSPSRVAWGMD